MNPARARRGRPPQGDRRRTIIRAAREVLAGHGYAHTSLKQIADHAGIAPGLLGYYFPAKHTLLLAVVSELEHDLISPWRDAIDQHEQPLRRIAAAFDAAIDQWSQQPELFQILYDLSTLAHFDEEIANPIRQLMRSIRQVAEQELSQISNDLPTPLPASVDLPAAVTAGFHGALYEALTLGQDPTPALRTLRFMTLSAAATSYLAAGQTPPIDLAELRD